LHGGVRIDRSAFLAYTQAKQLTLQSRRLDMGADKNRQHEPGKFRIGDPADRLPVLICIKALCLEDKRYVLACRNRLKRIQELFEFSAV